MAEARLLFLLSSDFGELSSAVDFLHGTGLHARLLLPRRLFLANKEGLAVTASPYDTIGDVRAMLDSERPDIVFLFSGYLYAINKIFDLPSLEALLADLRTRHLPVVTSDPFLGLLRSPATTPFGEQHPARQMLTEHFARVSAALRDLTHLYLGPSEALSGARKLSVFNPALIDAPGDAARRSARLAQRFDMDPSRGHWLFVVSAEDYGAQISRMGRDAFHNVLAQRLADAATAVRQLVLVAPQSCVDAITNTGRAPSGLVALAFCRNDDFADLMMAAEQVFYWNMLSHSLLRRLANRLPVCFFDHGHLPLAIPPLLPLAIDTYFSGVRLAVRDAGMALDPAALALDALTQVAALRGAVDRLLGLPGPAEIVAQLLQHTLPGRS